MRHAHDRIRQCRRFETLASSGDLHTTVTQRRRERMERSKGEERRAHREERRVNMQTRTWPWRGLRVHVHADGAMCMNVHDM